MPRSRLLDYESETFKWEMVRGRENVCGRNLTLKKLKTMKLIPQALIGTSDFQILGSIFFDGLNRGGQAPILTLPLFPFANTLHI